MGPRSKNKDRSKSDGTTWGNLWQAPNIMGTYIAGFNRHPLKRSVEILALASAYSTISQLSLSPVYGSIPASIYHQKLVVLTVILAYVTKIRYQTKLVKTFEDWTTYLPILTLVLPPLQSLLFKQSVLLGPLYGPLITETCTFAPILFLTILVAAIEIDKVDLNRYTKSLGAAGSLSLILVILMFPQRWMAVWMSNAIGPKLYFSRAALQYLISIIFLFKFPSRKLYIAGLLLSIPLSTNFHLLSQARTVALNEALLSHGYSLVARNESLTGYISVLDSVNDGFRVMRCDHSLLGGEWIRTPKNHVSGLRDPIYAIFTMLEAVRLVEPGDQGMPSVADGEKQALVIGLGIGTTPAALIAHGINTTVVEIDPLVYRYASQYFTLPANHNAVIQDAVTFVDEARQLGTEHKYDYIIHDVFTGGAEPASLFTHEFLTGLSFLLKADGVIAINYAGDLLLPSAKIVLNTVKSVFPSCRLFREAALLDEGKLTKDFTNMVMFCRKSASALSFRHPVEGDFLGSQARKQHLLPKHEIQGSYFDRATLSEERRVLTRGNTRILETYQQESALGHWKIMRTVLPDFVWENW